MCPIKADHVAYWDIYTFLTAAAIGQGHVSKVPNLEAAMVALESPIPLAEKLRTAFDAGIRSRWNGLLDALRKVGNCTLAASCLVADALRAAA
jgi:hypothetical protein